MAELLVVDLCGTLVRENTTHNFMKMASLGPLRSGIARVLLSKPVLYFFDRLAPDLHRRCLVACLRGIDRERLTDEAVRYARRALAANAREEVLDRLRSAKSNSRKVILASASLDFIVGAFVDELVLNGSVATLLAYDSKGVCLGRISRDATGQKLALLQETLGVQFEPFDVITDNIEDLDLLETAQSAWFIE